MKASALLCYSLRLLLLGLVLVGISVPVAFADSTITVSSSVSGVGGTIAPQLTNAEFAKNTDITFIITPNLGYTIASLTVDGSSKTPATSYVLNTGTSGDRSVVVTFTPVLTNAINTTVVGGNGTVVASPTTVNPGGSSTVTITPNPGYDLQALSDSGTGLALTSPYPEGLSRNADNSWTYSLTGINGNHTIVATFSPKVVYTITASAGAGGSITPAGAIAVNNLGSQIYTITPNAGYNVLNVVVDGVSQGAVTSYTFANVNTNHTIAVTFIEAHTILAGAGAHGLISPVGSVPVNHSDSKTFTITPSAGYAVSDVVVDGVSKGAITTFTFTNVTVNHTISATFVYGGASLYDYCSSPSFLQQNIKSNLLLMIDNSASSYDLAYTTPATYCYDESYSDAAAYSGNFEQGSFYQYDFAANKFIPSDLPAGGCTFKTAYACVNMAGAAPTRTVSKFVASGKFINWLSASKLDIQKKILTGGKYDALTNSIISESRGCTGRRFVKAVPALAGITFAVRGPQEASVGTSITTDSRGGETRIEIYDAAYNKTDCLAALNDWVTGAELGSTQTDTKNCLGAGADALKTSVYNHIIHDCYWFYDGHGLSNLNSLQNECRQVYTSLYGNDPTQIKDGSSPDAVCSSVLTHPFYSNNGQPNDKGFLGRCYDKDSGTWDDTCSLTENMDYCMGIASNGVTDPSSPQITGVDMPVPAFVIESGVNALGNIAGTFFARAGVTTAPTGVIEDFRYRINFGAMIFNSNGSGSECDEAGTGIACAKNCSVSTDRVCYLNSDCPTGESCVISPLSDGGKVISYINFDETGDHSVGLIKKIDEIRGTSWTPFGEAFYNTIGYFSNRTDYRINVSDFDATKNPSQFKCQKNNVLIITDGMSTADRHTSVNTLAATFHSPSNSTGWVAGSPSYAGSKNLDDLTWLAQNRNILDFTKTPQNSSEKILTHVIYSGPPCSGKAADGVTCTSTDETVPEVLMQHAANYGGGKYARASNPSELETLIKKIFQEIASGGSSGTAASILSNSEGSGANILQAVFYPRKSFDSGATDVSWIGELQNLWYYVDPFIGNSTVREDSDYTAADKAANNPHKFSLKSDYISEFVFNATKNETEVLLFNDTDGDGDADVSIGTVSPDDVKSIWRAGKQLWQRDLATSPRKIYTVTESVPASPLRTLSSNAADGALHTWESVISALQASDSAEAKKIIDFTNGYPDADLRSREIKIPAVDTVARPWRLGDIVSSTPRVQSSVKLNSYNLGPPSGYNDISYDKYVSGTGYKNRGMAYVGANDGMLHAFKFGRLDVTASDDQKATLTGTKIGEELWAFVPRNVQPYLKYLADQKYLHIFTVDGTPAVADVSIGIPPGCASNYWDCLKDTTGGTNWRTVLVGGMGIGGASRDKTTLGAGDFVKTPVEGLGYSSYFALDITNQTFGADGNLQGPPTFLWEFNRSDLGYATSGPAIVKTSATTDGKPNPNKNGRWFAVFASGPTGPIDGNACQFKGKSDQNLKLFVVDLLKGPSDGNVWVIDTGIANAFAGSISNGVIDTDRWNPNSPGNYQDDAIYIGYVKKSDAGTWTDGGVLRVLTKENSDPSQWGVSKLVDGIGPVTTNIAKLQDRKNNKLWLYFGTGRYFYNQDDTNSVRRIFGVTDPCYKKFATHPDDSVTENDIEDKACSTTLSLLTDLDDQTTNPSDELNIIQNKGWYITLEAANAAASLGAERIITDPVALTNGAVFFTSFYPTADPCQFGGQSYMWGLKYDNGGSLIDQETGKVSAALKGKALVQVSTGAFVQVELDKVFKNPDASAAVDPTHGGRKSYTMMRGKPPGDPPPILTLSNLKPVKKVIHIQER